MHITRLQPRGERWNAVHPVSSYAFGLVLCALAAAFTTGCAKPSQPARVPQVPVEIDPVGQVKRTIDALIDQPGHQRGTWAIVVHSLGRNERLYEHNPRTLLVPGSTMKLVSVAAAAEAVGWDYTFETTVLATGPIVDGALHGDLVIVGGGDPSILGRPNREGIDAWIEALRARGITRIDGRVIADDDMAEEPRPGFAWSWEDMGYSYGAPVGAVNFKENTIDIVVSPGSAEGLPTVAELPADGRDVLFVNHSRTSAPGTGEHLWPERRPGERVLTLNGTIAAGAKPAVVSAAAGNPTEWTAQAVRNRLLAAGVDVAGEPLDADDLPVKTGWPGAAVLFVHRSPPLSELAKPLVKDSINLYAEAVLRLATGRDGVRATDAALDAVRVRLQAWGVPNDGIQIVDGSGLSRRDVIAPETLVTILQRQHDPTGASPFVQSLAVAGRDGTLRSRMKGTPAEGNVRAKTGSLSNIRTMAGYVTTADGEPLAFAIMANNFEGPGAGVTATIDRILTTLASFTRAPR